MSEKSILEQPDEIFLSVSNQLGTFSMETVISGQWWRSHQFLALCYVLERWFRTQHQILFGNSSCIGSKIHDNTEQWTQLRENRWNSGGTFSQDSQHCSSFKKSTSSWTKCANPAQFQGRTICMSMFNDIIWVFTENERECIANASLVSVFAKRFPAGRWSFLAPG